MHSSQSLRSSCVLLSMAAFGLVTLIAGGCGSGDDRATTGGSGGGGGGGGSGGGGTMNDPAAEPYAVCGDIPTESFPVDVGLPCSAGSNEPLCALSSGECISQVCLWDKPAFKAYCTVGCDPAKSGSCPAGYTCKAQGCSEGPPDVCVSDGGMGGDICEKLKDAFMNSPPFYPRMDISAPDGQEYAAGFTEYPYENVVITRKPGQPWSIVFHGPPEGDMRLRNAVRVDDGLIAATEHGVFHLAKGEATLEDPWNSDEDVIGVFKTPSGAVRTIKAGYKTRRIFERGATGTWTPVGEPNMFIRDMISLEGSGLAAVCGSVDSPDLPGELCVGDNGDDMQPLALPGAHQFAGLRSNWIPLVAGDSPRDLFLFSRSGTILRRHKEAWVEDLVPAGRVLSAPDQVFSDAGFLIGFDGATYALQDAAPMSTPAVLAFRLEGDCWKPVDLSPAALDAPIWPLPSGDFGYFKSQNVVCVAPKPL